MGDCCAPTCSHWWHQPHRHLVGLPARPFTCSGCSATSLGLLAGSLSVQLPPVQVSKTLHSEAYVRALAYDPDGQYLASVTASGLLQVWDLSTGQAAMSLKAAAPKVCR